MKEANLMRLIQMAVSQLGPRVFRNNVGLGWVGNKVIKVGRPTTVTLNPGDVMILNARPLHAGLCDDSSDLIGWTSRVVTQDMVGKPVALFTALEVKVEGGRIDAGQQNFVDQVNLAGGIGAIVHSEAEAVKCFDGMLSDNIGA